jgi:hypothetical protein
VTDSLAAPLRTALADLSRWLVAERIPGAVIGGIAASVLGRPRFTRDIDALAIVPEGEWQKVIETSTLYGIEPRIDHALEFARRSRVLLLRHIASGIDIDVTFCGLAFEQAAVERATNVEIGDISIRLPRVEDLLVMKAVAGRPKDLEDIRGLLDAHPEADCDEARRWIREFAVAASMPDLLEAFDKLLSERQIQG